MGESGHHHNHEVEKKENGFANGILGIMSIVDGPVTLFRSIVEKFQKNPTYYHRVFKRVPTVDQCAYGDTICLFEADEQFKRDRKVDKFITHILEERSKECYVKEGSIDGFTKCRTLDDEYEKALTNYYIKYGDLPQNANVIDCYMKQKHRLIWQRRNPDKDLVGLDKLIENREKTAEYQNKLKNDPLKH